LTDAVVSADNAAALSILKSMRFVYPSNRCLTLRVDASPGMGCRRRAHLQECRG
jgi:hypothetical protein